MPILNIYKNRSTSLFTILILTSLILMIINSKLPFFNIRSLFFFFAYPIQYSITSAGKFVANLFYDISRIRELEKELQDYKDKLIKYQESLILLSSIKEENLELRKILDIKSKLFYNSKYAKIIYRDPTLKADYIIVDKGYVDGIKKNMPVVSYDSDGNIFLVGKIVEVNLFASKVMLITADNFYIGVTLKNSGYIGILKGEGAWNKNCVVDFIPSDSPTFLGEEVLTTEESDIFPKGIKIGTVVNIEKNIMEEFFVKLYVTPYFKLSKIKDLFIIDWTSYNPININIENQNE